MKKFRFFSICLILSGCVDESKLPASSYLEEVDITLNDEYTTLKHYYSGGRDRYVNFQLIISQSDYSKLITKIKSEEGYKTIDSTQAPPDLWNIFLKDMYSAKNIAYKTQDTFVYEIYHPLGRLTRLRVSNDSLLTVTYLDM